jgi:uncharacterized protein (DUF1778 family)
MSLTTPKEARLVARVSQDVQEFVKNAADLSGATLSQFIVEAVTAKARSIIDSEHRIKLTLDGANAVFDALENPSPINKNLLEAVKRHKEKGGFHYARDTKA